MQLLKRLIGGHISPSFSNGRKLKTLKANADNAGACNTSFTLEESESVGFYLIRAEYSSGSKVAKVIVLN